MYKIKTLILIAFVVGILLSVYTLLFSGKDCGGFMGWKCPLGYKCQSKGYADEIGKCTFFIFTGTTYGE